MQWMTSQSGTDPLAPFGPLCLVQNDVAWFLLPMAQMLPVGARQMGGVDMEVYTVDAGYVFSLRVSLCFGSPRHDRRLPKTQLPHEFLYTTRMISWSEIILVFFLLEREARSV